MVSRFDEWADKEGNLGRIYGAQWCDWRTADGHSINQIDRVIDQIKANPDSRRLIVSAWNVGELNQMALPPCHALFQFFVQEGEVLAREATAVETAAIRAGEMRRSAAIAADGEKAALEFLESTVAGEKVRIPIDRNLRMRGASLSAIPLFEGKAKMTWAKGVRYPAQIRDDTCLLAVGESFRRESGLVARTEGENILLSYERGFGKNTLKPECYVPGAGTSREALAALLEGDGFKVSTPTVVNLRDLERSLSKGEYVSIAINNLAKPVRQLTQKEFSEAGGHAVRLVEFLHFADGRFLVQYYDPWLGMFGTVDACTFSQEMFADSAIFVDPIVRRP